MTTRLFKIVGIGIALLFIQACSHPIEIVGQGDVTSTGERGCTYEESNAESVPDRCAKNLVVGAYQETYYATARPGWQFDHWGNYCATATPPNYDCSFNIQTATVKNFWGQIMPPLQAVFTSAGTPIPITDIRAVNGKVWAQPDLFLGLSWNQINEVCPGGACVVGAVLNGHSLTGWTWATVDDMNALFNSYIGTPELGPGPDFILDLTNTATWATEFFNSGWRITFTDPGYSAGTLGWTATSKNSETAYQAAMIERRGASQNQAGTSYAPPKGLQEPIRGSWFYR